MRSYWFAIVLFACAKAPNNTANNIRTQTTRPTAQGSQTTMTASDPKQPGGTGVDEHGVLLRSKPDPSEPKPDPKLVADDDANLLFYAGALVGDATLQRRTWVQLGLSDSAGIPTPKMTEFIRANQVWVKDRASVAATIATPAKARAYLDTHLK
jgi:hypothetical protein